MLGGFLGELGPRAPFYVAAGLATLNFFYGFFVLPESLAPENRRAFNFRRANPLGAAQHFSKLPQVSWFLIAAGIFFLAHTVFPSTWPSTAKSAMTGARARSASPSASSVSARRWCRRG